MPPVGLIRNPRATRGSANALPRDMSSAALSGVMCRAPDDFDGLDRALREMAAARVEIVMIEGGDGTVRDVLSRAPEIWAGAALSFAIVPIGNTNLIARQTGGVSLEDAPRLAAHAKQTPLTLLRVERGSGAPLIRGLILGAGAYEAATRFAQEEIAVRHGPQVLIAVLRFLFSRKLREPTDIGFSPDESCPDSAAPRLGLALTSLPGSLIYGINPFWGEGSGPIRWLDVAANPPRLLRAAFHVIRGKPRDWMKAHYRSGRAERITLRLKTPFVLDGELFDPGADGIVEVSASEAATFLTL